jgi:hypothetical protein
MEKLLCNCAFLAQVMHDFCTFATFNYLSRPGGYVERPCVTALLNDGMRAMAALIAKQKNHIEQRAN